MSDQSQETTNALIEQRVETIEQLLRLQQTKLNEHDDFLKKMKYGLAGVIMLITAGWAILKFVFGVH